MIISIFMFYYQKKGIPSENPFLFRKELYIKKHSSLSFIALLFMPRLSKRERPGAIGMLKAGVRVSGVARYHYCHPSTIQRLKDRYQVTGTVKDRRRSGQPRRATAIKSQLTSIVY